MLGSRALTISGHSFVVYTCAGEKIFLVTHINIVSSILL